MIWGLRGLASGLAVKVRKKTPQGSESAARAICKQAGYKTMPSTSFFSNDAI